MQTEIIREDAQTEVGSYFVANYPPFSAWSDEHVPAALEAIDSPPRDGTSTPLGLYMHIPFCRRRCKFCYFRVYTDKNARDVDAYVNALAREVGMYAGRPSLAGRQFDFVYFGGGTPSFLSSEQLRRLIDRISGHWSWDHAREVTFECEPGTLKRGKLETIKEIGVTRLSLGIEHFDDTVLEINGRAHRSPEIRRAYEWAREIGFPQINVDLIAGMLGDDEEKWKKAVDETLALEPDSLTIYQMELPHNTIFTREMKESGATINVADWATKRAWVNDAFAKFEEASYVVSSAYTMVKPSDDGSFVYRDALWRGADMVGTGVASFSQLSGVHFQNLDRWEDYTATIESGGLPVNRALPMTDHQRLVRELVLQLKLGAVDAAYFRDKFGVGITEMFADAFETISKKGFGSVNGDDVRLTRAGLLRADALLPLFFEPEFRDVRYT
jgi:oxygen-independent coproporphyrinogen-3 oxidase